MLLVFSKGTSRQTRRHGPPWSPRPPRKAWACRNKGRRWTPGEPGREGGERGDRAGRPTGECQGWLDLTLPSCMPHPRHDAGPAPCQLQPGLQTWSQELGTGESPDFPSSHLLYEGQFPCSRDLGPVLSSPVCVLRKVTEAGRASVPSSLKRVD